MTGQWAAVFVYDREHQAKALQALYGQDALVMPWPPEAARAGGIDRDGVPLRWKVIDELWDWSEEGGLVGEAADRILALVQPAPPALDLAVVRRILTAALPADPKWAGWVEGRIEEIAALQGDAS